MTEKKQYVEPELLKYEEKLDEVTRGVSLGSPDCGKLPCGKLPPG